MEKHTLDTNLTIVSCFDKASYSIVKPCVIEEAQGIDDLYFFDLSDTTMADERALIASSAPKEDFNHGGSSVRLP